MDIRTVASRDIRGAFNDFVELLVDSVNAGASVGYLLPMDVKLAESFWRTICDDLDAGTRVVVVAYVEGEPAGAVQLGLAMRPNSMHRAEVQKLLVHTRHRGQGIARRLMCAVEAAAVAIGRTLLVLDTKKGDVAEGLYEKSGYVRVGEIPEYVTNETGGFDATVLFYKHLSR